MWNQAEGKKIWVIAETPAEEAFDDRLIGSTAVLSNDLAYQHHDFRRQIVVFTDSGNHV